MQDLLGTQVAVYIGMTIVLFGFVGVMTGNALARTWRPTWQAFVYALPLAAADRFLIFALFEGQLLTLTGYIIDFAFISLTTFASLMVTRAHLMVRQYPWLYERAGLVGWRQRASDELS